MAKYILYVGAKGFINVVIITQSIHPLLNLISMKSIAPPQEQTQ